MFIRVRGTTDQEEWKRVWPCIVVDIQRFMAAPRAQDFESVEIGS